jgi:outer membrane PBP1 activator LpoA protein
VAGPLTRNGVVTLANNASITVPTLALNTTEARSAEKLYFFGLSAEAEARQVAHLAKAAKTSSAIIIHNGAPLSLRLVQAFSEEWRTLGGNIIQEIAYHDDPAALSELPLALGNMVFLAAGADKAHLLRPYIDPSLPVYATSQVFNGNADTLANHDLKDVRFVDMPWLLQLDHPAVMIYPRPDPPLEPDLERLYALGIDAYRLVQMLLENHVRTVPPLDGVTGRIQLGSDQRFQRTAVPALFKQGLGLTPEAAASLKNTIKAASGVPADLPAPADPQVHEQ